MFCRLPVGRRTSPDEQMTDAMLFETFSEGRTVIQHDFVRRKSSWRLDRLVSRTGSVPPGHREPDIGKLHLFEEAPFMRITWICRFEQKRHRRRCDHDIEDLVEIDVVVMGDS